MSGFLERAIGSLVDLAGLYVQHGDIMGYYGGIVKPTVRFNPRRGEATPVGVLLSLRWTGVLRFAGNLWSGNLAGVMRARLCVAAFGRWSGAQSPRIREAGFTPHKFNLCAV